MIGTMLAIPIAVTSFSYLMAIATTFVIDTWKGSKFIKTIFNWNSALIDWTVMIVFFLFPLLFAFTLLVSGVESWWSYTSTCWFVLVLAYYVLFSLCVIFYEIDGCLELIRYHPKVRNKFSDPNQHEWTKTVIYHAIVLRLKQRLSGYTKVSYISDGSGVDDIGRKSLNKLDHGGKRIVNKKTGMFSRLTKASYMKTFYKRLEHPVREYNLEEVLESSAYITNASWSLESLYCRRIFDSSPFVAIIGGEAAVTSQQVKSSIICFFLGRVLTLMMILGLLLWFREPVILTCTVVGIYAFVVLQQSKKLYQLNKAYQQSVDSEWKIASKSHLLTQVHEKFRVTEPKLGFCWTVFCLETLFFFIIPVIALFLCGNFRIGVFFIFMGFFTIVRNICNGMFHVYFSGMQHLYN